MKQNIELFSNPEKVFNKAKQIYGNNVNIKISSRKNKKYMILNPITNKWIHFGEMGYTDFTRHQDDERRKRFQIRNSKWSFESPYTPSFASFYLLW